jgi:hypothetical protein
MDMKLNEEGNNVKGLSLTHKRGNNVNTLSGTFSQGLNFIFG